MTIQNCKRCDSLYQKTIKDICSKCVNQEEEDYKKVRMYLKRHKTVEMTEVSRETEVDIELIFQFLQEGRISLGKGTTGGYPCKECGSTIHAGSLCTDCTNELNAIQNTFKTFSESQSKQPVAVEKQKKTAFHARDY